MTEAILITGATDGIGREAALMLAGRGHPVLAHGRNPAKGEKLLEELRTLAPQSEPAYYDADLADLAAVADLADELTKLEPELGIVIANAGVYLPQYEKTCSGYEKSFAVNHLSHFLLLNRLLYPLTRNEPGRIVIVASMAHGFVEDLPLDELAAPPAYDALTAYSRSKGANIVFTYELARRLMGSGVTCVCLHPGVLDTKLYRAGWGAGGSSPRRGAERLIYAALDADPGGIHGRYLENDRPTDSAPYTQDPQLQRELWELSEELTAGV